jgi:DNA-binding transcriptional LysR family regulator
MNKIDDMALFVRVVKAGGLASAGRQIGLSPASMTSRVNAIERRYNTRLLNRTTRKISLTETGQHFYRACLRVLVEVEVAEAVFQTHEQTLFGQLRITASSDFGRQYVAPLLSEFVKQNPDVKPHLHLSDGVMNLTKYGFDLGIRFGNLPDSNLIVRHLAENYRVLVASPDYLQLNGRPEYPSELKKHQCLVMERHGEPLNEWRFRNDKESSTIKIAPAFISNDGSIIRQWALSGSGIAYKSIWDVKEDLKAGKLLTVLDDFVLGFQASDDEKIELQLVYPSRQYVPRQVTGFIEYLKSKLSEG